jgi:hypothetical protein
MARPSNSRLRIKSDYVAALAVAIAPLVYFFPALRQGRILSPDDGVIFNVPLRVTAANLIRSGYLPLWDPYIFCGLPLHGAAQAGLLFPLNWFYLISSPPVATNLMMLSTYALAAIGAYLYARRAGADISGALATSLIWQLSAFMVEQIGHTNILHTAAVLPWTLWAVDGYVATGARRRGVLLVGLVALQVFAGHQQTLAYSLVLTGAYAFVMARASQKTRKTFFSLAAFILSGLALAAVQILPTFELLRNSLRATATYEFFGSFSMPPRFLLTFFAPYVLGGGNGLLFRAPYIAQPFFGEYAAYAGILTLMLALLAIILWRDPRTKFWGAIFVVALFMAAGRFMPFDLYQLFYHVPLLNLFRSPARHLMEVQFALAVLAGRGITAIRSRKESSLWPAAITGGAVFVLTCLTVTWLRPAAFHLSREVPVSVLRAPELFVPILIALLSAVALWFFARSKNRRALIGVFAILILDLFVYGQGSAWRTHSPEREHELWQTPETVKFLREREAGDPNAPFRILTEDQNFDPDSPVPTPTPGAFVFSLQPDIYMMHGIENAAGYDGFGLSRYSRLAGDMKVWGELTEAERALRGDSRELDLLNVRYLLTRSGAAASAPQSFPPAPQIYGNQKFAEADLGLPAIPAGRRLSFRVPPTEVDRLALLTNLAWSDAVPDHTAVAIISLHSKGEKTFDFELRAGDQTSEWSYDRADIRARIKHKRASVATSYLVDDPNGKFEGHTYVCAFALPKKTEITSGSITILALKDAPQLSLTVARVTLANGEQAFPLRPEWIAKDSQTPSLPVEAAQQLSSSQRWNKVAELKDVTIFENARMLPRVWLASEARVLPEPEVLQVIRTGKLADGKVWDPRQVALVEGPVDLKSSSRDESASAALTSREPNRVTVKTKSTAPAILVLSENHYPGWRAYVDGNLVETLRIDYNLRGVTLPAGEHSIEFVYRPKSVLIGLVISLLTLIAVVLWWKQFLPTQRSIHV